MNEIEEVVEQAIQKAQKYDYSEITWSYAVSDIFVYWALLKSTSVQKFLYNREINVNDVLKDCEVDIEDYLSTFIDTSAKIIDVQPTANAKDFLEGHEKKEPYFYDSLQNSINEITEKCNNQEAEPKALDLLKEILNNMLVKKPKVILKHFPLSKNTFSISKKSDFWSVG